MRPKVILDGCGKEKITSPTGDCSTNRPVGNETLYQAILPTSTKLIFIFSRYLHICKLLVLTWRILCHFTCVSYNDRRSFNSCRITFFAQEL